MLILTINPRTDDNEVHIGTDVVVKVLNVDIKTLNVKIGIEAPREMVVDRSSVRTKRMDKINKIVTE